ncbi:MAG: type II secretion system F family protein [Candidatus Hydrogenedentota bacterium]
MPIYAYKAISAQGGKSVVGEIVAENERHARTLLRESGVTPVSLREKADARPRSASLGWMAAFTRQLGVLLRAGFPMDKALTALASSASDRSMATVLTAINEGVSRGLKLSDALSRAMGGRGGDGVSSGGSELVAMIEAGEVSGDLAAVLLNYSELLEKRLIFRRRLRGALFYPLMVALIAVGVVCFLFIYVVPTITKLFEGTRMVLPLPTRILFVVSDLIQTGFWPGIAGIVLLAFLGRRVMNSQRGRRRLEDLLYALPMIGKILSKASVARWSRSFGSLLTNGVDILAAMEIAGKASGSVRYHQASMAARPRVAQGVQLARALQETGVFPALAVEAVTIGESSGALPQLMTEMAAGWESEVEASAERFADLLEPLMLIVMGTLVGGIVLAVLLPIFEFNAAVK